MRPPRTPLSQRQLFDLTPDSRDSARALLVQLLQAVLQTEAKGRDNHERQDHPESS